jgi:uncharacterized protein (TIGR02246 family)
MLRHDLRRLAIVYTVVVIAVLATAKISFSQDNPEVASLMALLSQHDDALNNKNLDTLMNLYADGDNTVMMGTGPGERWEGKTAIRSAYEQITKDYDKGSLTHSCYWKDGGVNGNMAWLAAMCKMADTSGKRKREYELNVSSVFEKINGQWLVRAMHYSNVVSGKKP